MSETFYKYDADDWFDSHCTVNIGLGGPIYCGTKRPCWRHEGRYTFKRIRRALYHVREGRRNGIPFCCVARWVVEWFIDNNRHQACMRGGTSNAHGDYVICQLIHRTETVQRPACWYHRVCEPGLVDKHG